MEKKDKISIGKINNVEIFAVTSESGDIFVPIKPICTALSINAQAQQDKIKAHPIYSPVTRLSRVTGADGKQYEMLCMELEFIYGWILSINPSNVGTASQQDIVNYQLQCHHILYDHFFRRSDKLRELDQAEREAVARLESLDSKLKEAQEVVSGIKAAQADTRKSIDKIRSARLDDQPTLF